MSKGKILVVDDDRLVLAIVSHGLSEAGYEVIDADNGDDAILLARQHRPQLALLDIRMEGKSGFDVAETLRDAYRISFIFLSAFADPATLAQVKALGALAHLIKPLDIGQIVPVVDAAFVRLRAAEAELPRLLAVPAPVSAPVPPPLSLSMPVAVPLPPPVASMALLDQPSPELSSAAATDPLALAVGVLMHRHSLARGDALKRLHRLAADHQLTPAVQAERLLAAVEELARTAL